LITKIDVKAASPGTERRRNFYRSTPRQKSFPMSAANITPSADRQDDDQANDGLDIQHRAVAGDRGAGATRVQRGA